MTGNHQHWRGDTHYESFTFSRSKHTSPSLPNRNH